MGGSIQVQHIAIATPECMCQFTETLESPGVRNFFLTLGGQWELVAEYLGYSKQEVDQILQKFPDSIENQVG